MNEEQLDIIAKSVSRLRERMADFSPVFFSELHSIAPETRQLFSSEEARRTKLSSMLSTFANARNLDKITPVLVRLSERHTSYGVVAGHYQLLNRAMTEAIGKIDPQGRDTDVQSAWSVLLQEFIQRMMPSGAETLTTMATWSSAISEKAPPPELPHQSLDASLYVETGGTGIIEQVHTRFYQTMFEDAWIGRFFLTKSMTSLILKQTRFMVAAFGGPDEYIWESPAMAHMHMMVTAEQADIRETLLRNAIRQEGLSQDIEERWLRVDQKFRPAIVKNGVDECVLRCPGQVAVEAARPVNYRKPLLIERTLLTTNA